MLRRISVLLLLFLVHTSVVIAQNKNIYEVQGSVYDTAGKAITFAYVQIRELALNAVTDNAGHFSFVLPVPARGENIQLEVSHVGKDTYKKTLISGKNISLHIVLNDLSYALPEIQVTSVRQATLNSNSSIVFDRAAIEQTQALSLSDILNYLPGKKITPPNVMDKLNITLRSEATSGSFGLNNAFGTAIVMDGSPVSNNANIQAVNVSRNGFGTANQIGVGTGRMNDYANNGIDLRQIPVENIESVEVISGVASARLGDYTDGAVLVNRQAGISPLRVSTRMRYGTQNISLSKGMKLSRKLGALSVSMDYLNSNEDPRDKFKSFNRVSGSVSWSYASTGKVKFKNTLTVDYATNIDKIREDPDDGSHSAASFKNYNFSVNNRSSLQLKKAWLKKIDFTVSYSGGKQDSYDQVYVNISSIKQITTAMETGIHEGYFVPGYYYAIRRLIGRPVNGFARLELNNYFRTGALFHNVIVGGNVNYSGNRGPGLVEDPNTPRTSNYNQGVTNRPIAFNRTLFTQTYWGIYAEDRITTDIANRPANISLGIRGDKQNGFFVVAPRISLNYALSKQVNLNAAFGMASKAPALLQINPGDVYYDIPLLSYYAGNAAENYYLAYTHVIQVRNQNLKSYTSSMSEAGLSWKQPLFRVSMNMFYKETHDGVAGNTDYTRVTLPVYKVSKAVPGAKPEIEQTGTKNYNVTYSRLNNALETSTWGSELFVNTNKVRSIQTSFTFNTSFYNTYYFNKNLVMGDMAMFDEFVLQGKTAIVGLYDKNENSTYTLKSGITASTHVSALRLVVSISGDIFWISKTKYNQASLYPVAYYTKDMELVPLTKDAARTAEYQHLWRTDEDRTLTNNLPNVYSNWHAVISKEIGNNLRFSFSAYNFLYLNQNKQKLVTTSTGASTMSFFSLRTAPSFGAELRLTL